MLLDTGFIHHRGLTMFVAAFAVLSFFVLPVNTAYAENEDYSQARQFIEKMADRTLAFVSDKDMGLEEKKKSFGKMLDENFALDTIGRFALGRYWRVATKEQKQEYQRLFRAMVIEVYSDRFDDYKGQVFTVKSARAEGEKDVLVTSYVTSPDKPDVRVDWRVRKRGNKYLIVDVIVEDVSMLMTKRSDFSSIIQRGGGSVVVLLEHLQKYGG